jgi:hypothetical protein
MPYLRLVALTVLLLLATGSPAHADRIRIDTDLSTLLAGSVRIAGLVWDAEDPIHVGGFKEAYSEVWFDGRQYTYLYGLPKAGDLDGHTRNLYGSEFLGRDPTIDFIELQTDLPANATWGVTDYYHQFLGVGFYDNSVSGGFDCAAPAYPDPLGCESGWVKTAYDAFTLEGDRLRGGTLGDETFGFYIRSDNDPIFSPLALYIIYSSQAVDDNENDLLGWGMIREHADVFAPSPIPEPGTLTLMLSGLGAGAVQHYRRRARQRRA